MVQESWDGPGWSSRDPQRERDAASGRPGITLLPAVGAAHPGNLPIAGATPATEPAGPVQTAELRQDRPSPADRTVAVRPPGWHQALEQSLARAEQGERGQLGYDGETSGARVLPRGLFDQSRRVGGRWAVVAERRPATRKPH